MQCVPGIETVCGRHWPGYWGGSKDFKEFITCCVNYDTKQDVESTLREVKCVKEPRKGKSASLGLSGKVSLKRAVI